MIVVKSKLVFEFVLKNLITLPIKILQFGQANFLHAFVDYAFLTLNKELDFNAGFAVIKTLSGEMLILSKNKIVIHLVFKWS